ncbi:complement decay-accelerating factor isoform X1 [Pleuronectes platessa]|uniref:complement decay-accelerating factor isoform X1 n=1 Tax=Pleuronectes platessa TaxID=8262 RepID=UPI00232A2093|nr:complement decay-accelerating factor isoform X1 [Pleuronectes platessa]
MDFLLDTCGRRRCLLVVMQLLVLKAAANCPKPQVGDHIVLTNEALLMNEFPEGSTATVECAHGFVIDTGSGVLSCTGGKWTELDLRCKKKDCGTPKPQPHLIFNLTEGTLFGAEIEVRCEKGFQISGSSFKMCYATGWSGRAKCEIATCELPDEVANGTSLWASQDEPTYGEIVEFACNDGFTLVGNKSIVCSDGGRYSPAPPECRGATTGDRITPSPAPTAQGSTSTDSSTISTDHRDKSITTRATATVSPTAQGGRDTLTEEASTTRASSTTMSSGDKRDGGVNTYTDTGYTAVVVSVVCVSLVATILVFGLYKFLQRKKGSYDTREDLKPELLLFQNL